jgi:CheY-like chemotaxis protein
MQVLLNLLTNAVKFTPERGKVSLIVAQETETALIFSVIDTGIGIAPDHFTEIFQPFLQIDSRLNRQQMGTGLGLSLVKRLMDLQGGTVSVTSEVGVGSCFRLEFPLEPSLLSDPGKKSFPLISNLSSDSALSLPLILLVDNHRPNVRSVSSYLTAKGFRIRVAANAQEAIALAQIDRPDLILLDMPLSEKEGLTILGQMSGDRQFSQIPIIALIDPALSRDRYLTAGAKDALAKPLKLRLLTRIIEQNLGIRSLA